MKTPTRREVAKKPYLQYTTRVGLPEGAAYSFVDGRLFCWYPFNDKEPKFCTYFDSKIAAKMLKNGVLVEILP